MDISTAHAAAVLQACRLPALYARLALLVGDSTNRSTIEFHGGDYPSPPGSGTPTPLVTLSLTAAAGTVEDANYRIVLAGPLEAQVAGADAGTGTVPTWARVGDPAGAWWGDLTVSVEGGGGEIEMPKTAVEGGVDVVRWFNGAFVRLNTLHLNG